MSIEKIVRGEYAGGVSFVEQKDGKDQIQKLIKIAEKVYPELSGVRIEFFCPEDGECGGGFYTFDDGGDGRPVAVIAISSADPSVFNSLLYQSSLSVQMHADMLGIPFEKMTPDLLQLFIVAHELGHIRDFKVNFESDPELPGWEAVDEMQLHRDAVLSMLPVPNVSPSRLFGRLKDVKTLGEVVDIFPDIKKYPDFKEMKNVKDVLRAQELFYRKSPPEKYADEFAARFLLDHAEELGIADLFTEKVAVRS